MKITVASGNTSGTSDALTGYFDVRNIKVVAPDMSGKTFRVKWIDKDGDERNEYNADLSDNGTHALPIDDWPVKAGHKFKIVTSSSVGSDQEFTLTFLE